MNKQKIQLNYNKNQQNKQYKNKDNIITYKSQLNVNKRNVGQLPAAVLDLLKVFYNTRSDNKIRKYSRHQPKITTNNSINISTISSQYKQQSSTSKLHMKRVNENIQPTTDEYTLFIPVIKIQKNVKLYNWKNKQSHKIKATSFK